MCVYDLFTDIFISFNVNNVLLFRMITRMIQNERGLFVWQLFEQNLTELSFILQRILCTNQST